VVLLGSRSGGKEKTAVPLSNRRVCAGPDVLQESTSAHAATAVTEKTLQDEKKGNRIVVDR